MSTLATWLGANPNAVAILIGAILATVGWIWTARHQRAMLRKQHTFNALLEASFNDQFQNAHTTVRPYIRQDGFPPDLSADGNKELHDNVVFLLNHYEFLAAGIRNGDISERLLKNNEKGAIIALFDNCEEFIEGIRNKRNRKATFEHIEWLYDRWHANPPKLPQRILEVVLGRELYHNYHFWIFLGGAGFLVLVAVSIVFHL